MPSLTINGQSINVDASFDKLSPEDQQATVVHIAKQLHDGATKASGGSDKPSGAVAGFAQGVSDLVGGNASTLGLTGTKTPALDKMAAAAAPKDYKAAPLIKEGGHWYNPSDYQPGNLPQIAAQALPGIAQDFAAGKTGGAIGSKVGGARGAVVGGVGSVLASIAARTFGKGAHDNAEARTGDANAEVTGSDMLREAGKQALAAPLNAFGGARLAGIGQKAVGVGASGAGKALLNAPLTGAAEAVAGGTSNAINQLGTSLGQEHGKPFEGNQVAEAAAGSGLAGTAMVTPRMYGQLKNAGKFRDFGGDNKAAATDLANDINTAADGKGLVGTVGGTKTARNATDTAVRNTTLDLKAAAEGVELSPDNAKTLARIQAGGKANGSELSALDAEAPDVGHLARKALIGAKLKSMGNFTDKGFSGGLSGVMDKSVKAVANPVGAATVAGSSALAGSMGVLGSVGLPVLGTIAGGYMAARAMDKLTGSRSPAQGFTDTFADPNAPGRPAAPLPPEVDPNYDPTTLKQSLNTNAKLEEGMAKIAGKLGAEKRKAMLAEAKPLLERLADTRTEPEAPAAPEMPSINPVALKMTQARLKAGLPPIEEPAAPVAPAPVEPPPVVISPIARKMLEKKLKEGLPPEPTAQIAPTPAPAPEVPSFNPTALKMLQQKLKTPLPPGEAPAPLSPEASVAAVPSSGPASDAIGALMAHLRAKSAAGVQAPQQAPQAPPQAAPVAPPVAAPPLAPTEAPPALAPVMAKINKKSGEDVKQTPHPEADQPYSPLEDGDLYRRHMTDDEMVQHEFSRYEPAQRKAYAETAIKNREGNREDTLGVAADFAATDRAAANALYHQLDHTKDPDVASKVIDHYTAKMSPDAAAAIKERYTPAKIAKRWKKKKSK